MSGADDLRTAIAMWHAAYDAMPWDYTTEKERGVYFDVADRLLKLLADPVRRLAILSLIGVDVVREGFARIEGDAWQGDDGDAEAEGYIDVERWQGTSSDAPVIVCRVRPRGEATDA